MPNTVERGSAPGSPSTSRPPTSSATSAWTPRATPRATSTDPRPPAGDLINIDVYSRLAVAVARTRSTASCGSYADPSRGKLLSPVADDNGFQGLDPSLDDLILPADGTYTVEVDTFNPPGGADAATGDYELFLYRSPRPRPARPPPAGDTLVGGSGLDTLIGSSGNDLFEASPQTKVVPGSGTTP